MTAVGFEPTPLRNGALSHRLRPLGQTVLEASHWFNQYEQLQSDLQLTFCFVVATATQIQILVRPYYILF